MEWKKAIWVTDLQMSFIENVYLYAEVTSKDFCEDKIWFGKLTLYVKQTLLALYNINTILELDNIK